MFSYRLAAGELIRPDKDPRLAEQPAGGVGDEDEILNRIERAVVRCDEVLRPDPVERTVRQRQKAHLAVAAKRLRAQVVLEVIRPCRNDREALATGPAADRLGLPGGPVRVQAVDHEEELLLRGPMTKPDDHRWWQNQIGPVPGLVLPAQLKKPSRLELPRVIHEQRAIAPAGRTQDLDHLMAFVLLHSPLEESGPVLVPDATETPQGHAVHFGDASGNRMRVGRLRSHVPTHNGELVSGLMHALGHTEYR